MGLFSKIGKSISGTLKNVSKGISTKNIINVATGNIGAVGKEMSGRALKGALTPFVKTGGSTTTNPTLAAQQSHQAMIQALSITGKLPQQKSLTGNAILDSAIGGALAGAGVGIGGTQAGNAAVNATGWTAAKTWLRNNWIAVTGGIAATALIVWAIFFRKPKKGGIGKKIM